MKKKYKLHPLIPIILTGMGLVFLFWSTFCTLIILNGGCIDWLW